MITLSKKRKFLILQLCLFSGIINIQAQTPKDSIADKRWNFHFQNTVIYQVHPSFHSAYSGKNSLNSGEERTTSISGTIYLGAKLWKGASVYYNPEISGGSGFSSTLGIAGFPNGEVYRVSDLSPTIYSARLYLKQVFALSDRYVAVKDGINQLPGRLPDSYFAITAGKFSIMDFFDCNKYSHDPRNQFYNWALMGNGAWDYPANTRGYTFGFVAELVKPQWSLRLAAVMVPKTANGAEMDRDILHASSEAIEFVHQYTIGGQSGNIGLMTYLTEAQMGNYAQAIELGEAGQVAPNVESTRTPGRTKYGFGLNIEHHFSENVGAFLRASWNDGHNETWVFTEIDRAVSAGLQFKGDIWKRAEDKLGFALMANGLSEEHRNYLKAGGYGFIIGDGNLNYQPEMITELYYSFRLGNYPLWISPDYQFILNPAYNKDRGPVHAFGVRVHLEI